RSRLVRCHVFHRSDFFAGANANDTVDDNPLAALEAVRNDPVQPDLLTQSDWSNLGDIVGANDVDKGPLWTLAHRFFANCDRIEQRDAKDTQADELAWEQQALRIGKDHACLDRAGLRIDARSGRVKLAPMRVEAAIAERQLNRQVFIIDRLCAPFIEVAEGLPFLIRE